MSSIVNALYELKYNPFEYGAYLASFYKAMDESENNLLLAPLIIPLCSHPFFSLKLNSANINSSIFTIFNGETRIKTERDIEKYGSFNLKAQQNKIVHKELLYDLQERIDGFQTLTEQCIQYCLINDWLSVNEQNLSLHACNGSSSEFLSQKSAKMLGSVLSGHSVVDIYAYLGVKPR
ncbi:three component ABC system middle component [Psychromonas ossibalaenae]|uniref:three component ABC system middle component n=1 Tax=Psychromonas ossibalaenae TaxID=444922 RepID=UPI0003814A5F|nr:three component ABC system middle component [Psychromonas ossibalaenae]